MLSPADQCVSVCVCVAVTSVCDDDVNKGRAEPDAECPSFLCLQEPNTSVQSQDGPISMTLGSALHQRLCQQGLFRRRPATDCDAAGVFPQNGAI